MDTCSTTKCCPHRSKVGPKLLFSWVRVVKLYLELCPCPPAAAESEELTDGGGEAFGLTGVNSVTGAGNGAGGGRWSKP